MKRLFAVLLCAVPVSLVQGQTQEIQRPLRVQLQPGTPAANKARAFRLQVGDKKVEANVQKGKEVDDQTFAKKAAMGGMAEVKLGQLAQEKATDPAVKKFGKQMVDDHSKANKELMQVAGKNNIILPKDMGKKHKEHYDRLAKLEGSEFDREYMKHMVKDHEEDAAEFAEAAKGLKNEDLRVFAAKTLPVIQAHLKMAQGISGKLTGTGKTQ